MENIIPVQMIGITKRFPGVLANDAIDLNLYAGEVHGLLGENGAGKTTLMNILFGLHQPDQGEIRVFNQPVLIHSPGDAIALSIGMVHQHFRLVQPFTVVENIILGLEEGGPFLDMKSSAKKVMDVADQYGLKIDPYACVQELSVGEQQRVEILNSLYRGANILILDEPTSVLTPQEADDLGVILKGMTSQGKAIVFISHKLDEIFKVTNRVTVVRSGKVVFSGKTEDTDRRKLAHDMIGREITKLKSSEYTFVLGATGLKGKATETVRVKPVGEKTEQLCVKNLCVNDDRGLAAVRGINLTIHSNEILGIAGVDGNGQRELVEAITGLRPINSGEVWTCREESTRWSPHDYIQHNIAYITDDRHGEGLVLGLNLCENAVLKYFERAPYSKHGLLNEPAIEQYVESLIKTYDVRAANTGVNAGTLSGGNQQKFILGRELTCRPPVIIANKPTRGLDIGAAANIHEILVNERARGAAILLVSADLDELFALCDRIMVIFNGQSMGEMPEGIADAETIGLMMTGTPISVLRPAQEDVL
ncbi:MAG TPA: ABC transporter ATP-binding protein [Anaerolineaceae bacterium]